MRVSDREWLAGEDADVRAGLLRRLDAGAAERLAREWRFLARPAQLAPAGDWRVWLMMAGRGFGKTRAGAEWVRSVAEADPEARIALVGATLGEARAVMVEGASGVLSVAPWWARPRYAPALRRLTWPNGAMATLFGAAEPEGLRGPQFSHGWADEIAKWAGGEAAWDNLMMGMRLGGASGSGPRVLATTTPRPVPLVRRLVGAEDVAVTKGTTAENEANLAPGFVAAMAAHYGGTRLGRGDACGIVVAGLGSDGRGYVIADASVEGQRPEGWARAVAAAAMVHGADRVVAEANNGGQMVESVLRAAEAALPVRLV
ncbi:terminase large subunit domain-containing protein, partial [Sphingobium sp. CCH11-B1]|uniref:terminase large subunit domain-containing protein n=1 Tax=Sphingobium sp. CCH11-B1 TaxID=1768781 RepID=UPI0009E8BFD2